MENDSLEIWRGKIAVDYNWQRFYCIKFDHCLNELTLCLIKKKEKKKEGPWWNKEPSLACRLSKFDKDFIFSVVCVIFSVISIHSAYEQNWILLFFSVYFQNEGRVKILLS